MIPVYEEQIREYGPSELMHLWESVQQGEEIPGWEPGKAFEYLILRAFEIEGARVVWPYQVEIEGNVVEQIDGAVYLDALSCLVEAKDHRANIDIASIAKLRNQLLRRPPSVMGIVFSRMGFTEPAKILTRYTVLLQVLLWEGQELSFALAEQHMCDGLRTKYRYAVERGIPDYYLKVGLL